MSAAARCSIFFAESQALWRALKAVGLYDQEGATNFEGMGTGDLQRASLQTLTAFSDHAAAFLHKVAEAQGWFGQLMKSTNEALDMADGGG